MSPPHLSGSYELHLTEIGGTVHAAARTPEGRITPILIAPLGKNAEARLRAFLHALPLPTYGVCTGVVLPCYDRDWLQLDIADLDSEQFEIDYTDSANCVPGLRHFTDAQLQVQDRIREASSLISRTPIFATAVHVAHFWHCPVTRYQVHRNRVYNPRLERSPHKDLEECILHEIKVFDGATSKRIDTPKHSDADERLPNLLKKGLPREVRGKFDLTQTAGQIEALRVIAAQHAEKMPNAEIVKLPMRRG